MSDRPMYIHSRATRMWKVIRVHSVENPTPIEEGKFLVLKDFWIPHDIPTEVENQQRLFEAVDAFIADPHWKADPRLKEFDKKTTDRLEELFTDKKYQSLFLTNLHAWRGRTSKPVAKGAWISPDPSQYRLWEPWLTSYPEPGTSSLATSTTHTEALSNVAPLSEAKARRYTSKQQARFIYEEVCTPLHSLSTLGAVMDVLAEALQGERYAFSFSPSFLTSISSPASHVLRGMGTQGYLERKHSGLPDLYQRPLARQAC